MEHRAIRTFRQPVYKYGTEVRVQFGEYLLLSGGIPSGLGGSTMALGFRVSQVASELDTSPDTVRRLFDRGILRGERTGPGQYRRISPESLGAFKVELTVSEAAKLLGVCSKTVRKYVDMGLLEGTRTPGGHRRVLRSSVETLTQKGSR